MRHRCTNIECRQTEPNDSLSCACDVGLAEFQIRCIHPRNTNHLNDFFVFWRSRSCSVIQYMCRIQQEPSYFEILYEQFAEASGVSTASAIKQKRKVRCLVHALMGLVITKSAETSSQIMWSYCTRACLHHEESLLECLHVCCKKWKNSLDPGATKPLD